MSAERPSPPTPEALYRRLLDILPLPRSLTGPGVSATLDRMGDGLVRHRVPTGTKVLDWEIPDEWTLRRAVLTGPDGEVIADSDTNPLHVLGYSTPVDVELDLDELQDHLWSDPELPDAIPYRNSYYSRRWGFCLSENQRASLRLGTYHARIDADLRPGHLEYGERTVRGRGEEEMVVVSHICHPGMANDNASGNVVAAAVADHLAAGPTPRRTWRFVWMPGTIGEIAWLATRPEERAATVGGIGVVGVGDRGPLSWKRSRTGAAEVDRAAALVLPGLDPDVVFHDYSPWGYAERQFNSLGVGIPMGRLSRTEHGTYPEYHTSADNEHFVTGPSLRGAFDALVGIVDAVDANLTYRNLAPDGEPRLGPRGLYPSTGGQRARDEQLAMLWILSESDGRTDLLDIAARSGLAPDLLDRAAVRLAETDLLEPVG